jgi:hypothetical protein
MGIPPLTGAEVSASALNLNKHLKVETAVDDEAKASLLRNWYRQYAYDLNDNMRDVGLEVKWSEFRENYLMGCKVAGQGESSSHYHTRDDAAFGVMNWPHSSPDPQMGGYEANYSYRLYGSGATPQSNYSWGYVGGGFAGAIDNTITTSTNGANDSSADDTVPAGGYKAMVKSRYIQIHEPTGTSADMIHLEVSNGGSAGNAVMLTADGALYPSFTKSLNFGGTMKSVTFQAEVYTTAMNAGQPSAGAGTLTSNAGETYADFLTRLQTHAWNATPGVPGHELAEQEPELQFTTGGTVDSTDQGQAVPPGTTIGPFTGGHGGKTVQELVDEYNLQTAGSKPAGDIIIKEGANLRPLNTETMAEILQFSGGANQGDTIAGTPPMAYWGRRTGGSGSPIMSGHALSDKGNYTMTMTMLSQSQNIADASNPKMIIKINPTTTGNSIAITHDVNATGDLAGTTNLLFAGGDGQPTARAWSSACAFMQGKTGDDAQGIKWNDASSTYHYP